MNYADDDYVRQKLREHKLTDDQIEYVLGFIRGSCEKMNEDYILEISRLNQLLAGKRGVKKQRKEYQDAVAARSKRA